MNINKACGCYAIISRKYGTYQCRVWALIDTADTATRIPSFTAPAYLVTESYGGKVLDSLYKTS